MSFTSILVNKMFANGDKKRDEGLFTPDNIVRYDDIFYGETDETWQRLDVYRPKDIEGKLPVIMIVHGGGWVYGSKEVYQFYAMNLAQRGFAVVNYSYRLAPRYKYPASMEDTVLVCEWILRNAEKYGLDVNNIFAAGDSAGGHMLGLLANALTNEEYRNICGFRVPENFRIKGVALNCGVYNIEPSKKKDLTSQLMADFLPHKGSAEELNQISVLHHVTENFPPAFIMSCPGDFLLVQAKPLADALTERGCKVEYHIYGNEENPLAHVFHINIKSVEADQCNTDECNFFKSLM